MSKLIDSLDNLSMSILDIRADILSHLLIEKTDDEILKMFDKEIIRFYRSRLSLSSGKHQKELDSAFSSLLENIPIDDRKD